SAAFIGIIGGSVALVIGIPFNATTIYTLIRTKKLHNITYFLMGYICVCDLTLSSFSIPIVIIADVSKKWIFGQLFCEYFSFINNNLVGIQLQTLLLVSLNRCFLMCLPNVNQVLFSKMGLTILSMLTFILSTFVLFWPLPRLWGRYGYSPLKNSCTFLDIGDGFTAFATMMAFGFPITGIVICYSCIFIKVRNHQRNISNRLHLNELKNPHKDLNDHEAPKQEGQLKKQKKSSFNKELKMTKMMVAVIGLYILCYMPIMFTLAIDKNVKAPAMHRLGVVLVWSYGILNNIIFLRMNSLFRDAYFTQFEILRCRKYCQVTGTDIDGQSQTQSVTQAVSHQ
ncbi:unnamed protein product, partial [Owenia fusiformis]